MIKVENLNYIYNNKNHALKDVNFHIHQGSWVSILGHNGSGKSTLSKLLVGLLKAKSGQIYVDNLLLTPESITEIRRKVGIVFQNPDNQFVGVTVKHDIAFGLENMQIERLKMIDLVKEYAEKVDMESNLNKEPHLLSGGQKQRVAIAGTLAMNQEVIILDEATSMLDPEGVNEIVKLIRDLSKVYHKTLITITHDLNLARLSDRIIVLKEGQVVLDDIPDHVFKNIDVLKNASLDIPFNLKLYNEINQDDKLKNHQDLLEAVWELNSKR